MLSVDREHRVVFGFMAILGCCMLPVTGLLWAGDRQDWMMLALGSMLLALGSSGVLPTQYRRFAAALRIVAVLFALATLALIAARLAQVITLGLADQI